MKKYAKPTTGAFVLNSSMVELFFKGNHVTSKDVIARFEKNQRPSSNTNSSKQK